MNTKTNILKQSKKDNISLLPVIILIAIVPLIVHLRIIPIDQTIMDFWNNDKQNTDFFSYYKSISIITASILSILMLAAGVIMGRFVIKKTYLYIPFILYTLLVILSSVLSKYKYTALHGFPDRYEGALVLIAYMAAFFVTINLVNQKEHVKLLLASLFISAVIIGTIGLFQYFGYDFFKTSLGKLIMLPLQFRNQVAIVKSIYESKTIFSTLYNSNTLGMYMSMLFPLSLSLFILIRNSYYKIIMGAITCLMFANLIGSNSRGSYISILITTLMIFIIIRKHLAKAWKHMACIVLCFSVIYIGLNYYSTGTIGKRMESIITSSDIHTEDNIVDKIKDFKTIDNQLSLYCTNSMLKIIVKDNQILFCDEKDKNIDFNISEQNKIITMNDNRYNGVFLMLDKNLIKVQKGKSFLYFAVINNSFKFLNSKGKVMDIITADKLGFEGKERFASGRGYIWSRTLPLIKHTLIFGNGPDTFAIYFPQNDYMGKLNYMYDANMIIDKPHDMYLQTAVNTGALTLLALLFIFAFYCIKSILLFYKSKFDDFYSITGLSIFAAVLGYLVSGIFTDSTVSVAPVFWILLGLGIGINYKMYSLNS